MAPAVATPADQLWRSVSAPARSHPDRAQRLGRLECTVGRERSIPAGGRRKLVRTPKIGGVHHDAMQLPARSSHPTPVTPTSGKAAPPFPSSTNRWGLREWSTPSFAAWRVKNSSNPTSTKIRHIHQHIFTPSTSFRRRRRLPERIQYTLPLKISSQGTAAGQHTNRRPKERANIAL